VLSRLHPLESSGENWRLILGDSGQMEQVQDDSVRLVLTSPPFFDKGTEKLLRMPRKFQNEYDQVRQEVATYAASFMSTYQEVWRVVHEGGHLIIQTKDLRYGGCLIPLTSLHRSLAESLGFRMIEKIYWRRKADRRSRSRYFLARHESRLFQVDDLDDYLIFKKPGESRFESNGIPIELLSEYANPVWHFPSTGSNKTHPYQSPLEPLRRFISLYSNEGDLILDPFAGHGTTLRVAVSMKRKAIGWEINQDHFKVATKKLSGRFRA
jgi:DNA modification methylase